MISQRKTFDQRSFLLKVYVASIAVIVFYLVVCPVLKPRAIQVATISVLGGAFLLGYFFTLRSQNYIRSSHFYIISCYLTILVLVLFNGGIGAPGIIWLLICPLIAFIILSTRYARLWLAIIVATVSLLYASDITLGPARFHNRKDWYLVSYILFFPMVYSVLKIFRKEVSKKVVELGVLNERLKDESDMLQKSQTEILLQSARIKEAESTAHERSLKLAYYLDQLIEVKRMEEVHSGNLQYSVRAILHFLKKSMLLSNAVLWQADGPGKPLKLMKYVGDGSDVYERAMLFQIDFPGAYDMLQSGAIISGVNNNIREAEQLRHLFRFSVGSDSMINCPYFLDGKFAGFISCRAAGRNWSPEDIIFVRAVSDTISLAFKSHVRIGQQQMLEEKQREITEINESLERKVLERTLELNKRNRQLTDFAFTNAHHIRGPICRLLGLRNLLTITDDCREVLKIADYMSASVGELDQITKETSEKLNALVEENEWDHRS